MKNVFACLGILCEMHYITGSCKIGVRREMASSCSCFQLDSVSAYNYAGKLGGKEKGD